GPRSISRTHRTFWPVTTVEKPSPPTVRSIWVAHSVPSSATKWTLPSPGTRASITPERSCWVELTTTVEPGSASISAASRRAAAGGVAGEAVADVAGVLVADHDRVDDLVVTARARRVVRAVEHQIAPRELEQTRRVALGGKEERAHRLGPALDRPLGRRARLV